MSTTAQNIVNTVKVLLQREEGAEDLPLPQYQTSGSSGMDLCCAIQNPIELAPGARILVSAGFSMSLPQGYEAQVRPRSGLALKYGITILNTPGTIDCDYRGIVSVIVYNAGSESFTLTRGLRIAQMVIQPVTRAVWETVDRLDETVRSSGGFGHTGH